MREAIVYIFFMLMGIAVSAKAEEKILICDFRNRPPEMCIDENRKLNGPLKDILEEAAQKLGYTVKWQIVPFKRSLYDLQKGNVDIVPRTIRTREREEFINYLGEIGYQDKDILFLTRKDVKKDIKSYEDLYGKKIGVKKGTAYFDQFDHDNDLNKIDSIDDKNMALMFINRRFDTMIILDKKSIEEELEKNNFTDYVYAEYVWRNIIGNFYGMSKKSKHKQIYNDLNNVLYEMKISGKNIFS